MSTYNSTFLHDFSQPTGRRDQVYQGGYYGGFQGQQPLSGNGWHQKMGYQKPNNLDQSIHTIRTTEHAPFTREPEQPSIATLYIQQRYGGLGGAQQDQDYGMEDAPPKDERSMTYRRASNSPDRAGIRRPGPDWGNTQFGTKPRRRSIVETESRQVYDENAPPLLSFYDDMIAAEQRQLKIDNAPAVSTQPIINGTANGKADGTIIRRPVFDNPKSIRVSNYSEPRWPQVLAILAQYGVILERFEELRRMPNYEPIPARVMAESDDEVVKSARMFFTGEGWTKVTFAAGEAADKLIAQSEKITVGGRLLVVELWKPELHGKPSQDGSSGNSGVLVNGGLGASTTVDVPMPGALPRKRTEPQSIFDDPFATPRPVRVAGVDSGQMPLSTPGGSMLSTQMRGAKVVTLRDGSEIFKEKPGIVSRILSKIWGEVGLHGWGEQVVENGWRAWFIEMLFGKL